MRLSSPHCGQQAASDTQSRTALACLLVLAAGLRIWIANFQPNIIWGDEIFQVVEPAHRLVYGNGLIAWEWVVGMRSWLFPGVIAGVLWLGRLLGTDPAFKQIPVQLFMVLCSLIPVATAFRWGERLDGQRGGIIVGGFVAVWIDLLYFASHPLSDVIASDVLMAALYAALPLTTRASTRRLFIAGTLFGLTFALRMQLGPALLVAAIFACGREPRSWGALIFGGTIVLAAAAGLDWITLGTPLQSIWLNFWLNVVKGVSSDFGVVFPLFFVGLPIAFWGPVSVLIACQLIIGGRRFPALLAVVVTIFFVQSLFLHKEWRFVFPAVPPLIALCGIATLQELSDLRRYFGQRLPSSAPLTASALIIWSLLSLMVAIGPNYSFQWSLRRELIQAFALAARQPALCGLNILSNINWPATPGSAALPGSTPIYKDLAVNDRHAAASYNVVVGNAIWSLPLPYRRLTCIPGSWVGDHSYMVACVWMRSGTCSPGHAKTPQPNWPHYFLDANGKPRWDRIRMYQR